METRPDDSINLAYDANLIHACGEGLKKHKDLSDPFCYQLGFLAGAAYERERAKGLAKALDYCLEHTDDRCWCGFYGDDSEETGPSTCHLCNARNELIKWRQHDSK